MAAGDGRDRLAEPAEHRAAAHGDHLVDMAVGDHVPGDAQAAPRVDTRLVGHRAPGERGPGPDAQLTGRQHAAAERGGLVVPAAGRDHRRGGQAQPPGGVAGEGPDRLPGAEPHRRQDRDRDARRLAQLAGPVVAPPVVDQAARQAAGVGRQHAGQPLEHVVLGLDRVPCRAPHVRPVATGPVQVGQHQARGGHDAADVQDPVPPDRVEDRRGPRRVATVGPVDRGGQDAEPLVEQDDRVALADDAQPGHVRPGDAGRRQQLVDRGDEGIEPVGRVVLRPAGMRAVHPVWPLGDGEDARRRVDEDGLERGRADVGADQERSHEPASDATSLACHAAAPGPRGGHRGVRTARPRWRSSTGLASRRRSSGPPPRGARARGRTPGPEGTPAPRPR